MPFATTGSRRKRTVLMDPDSISSSSRSTSVFGRFDRHEGSHGSTTSGKKIVNAHSIRNAVISIQTCVMLGLFRIEFTLNIVELTG